MSWTLYYANPDGSGEQSVSLEALGALEGGTATGDGIVFSFESHKESTVRMAVAGLDPSSNPRIPFMGRVRITDAGGGQQFVGRRTDWDGSATPDKRGTRYTFSDAWWDMTKITFKQVWFSGGYMPVTVAGSTVTFGGGASVVFAGDPPTAQFYDANKNQIGAGWTVTPPPTTPATGFTVSGGTGAIGAAKYVVFVNYNTDVVLFQYRPGDPYQNAGQVVHYYITTGAQIIEILNFAIAQGVQLQVGQIDPSIFVPWYPVRCQNCAEALKVCLRDHPDCFTEIDYTTAPPTFHVRRRASLAAVLRPYKYTDANGVQHVSTDVRPRPDLVPSRVGIFYRYLVNGNAVAFPQDIYPPGTPDGLLALDYSVDLQGPRTSASSGEIDSVAFDPTALAWWKQKCAVLNTAEISGLAMTNADGTTYTGADLKVVDDAGNPVDYAGTYMWEMVGGSRALWMSGVNVVSANVTSYFKYQKKNAAGVLDGDVKAHVQTVRVNLVNTASISQSYYAFLTTGEAIPANLAEEIYQSLQPLQYELKQSQREEPFASFVKPGKHCLNLDGGNAAWETMAATVQQSTYTLRQRPDGTVWAVSDVKCGPVAHLEAGQLVQLFNIFANRDLSKIDPWERITGQTGGGAGSSAVSTTARENTNPGLPDPLLSTHVNTNVDVSGNFSTVQTNVKTSGHFIFKWDGSTVDGTGARTRKADTPAFMLDMSDIQALVTAAGTVTPVSGFTLDDVYLLKAREVKMCDDSGNIFYAIVLIGGGYTKS